MKTAQLLGALALIGVAVVVDVGCVARARTGVYVEAGPPVVFVEPPTLIEIDTGVWVVRDYDYPVYYVGSAYWVYHGDVWYRSETYDGGWSRIDVDIVPTVIVRRDHSSYVHYHGAATARTRVGPRGPQMRPASADRQYEPARRGPPERAVEPRRGPPERVVQPRRGPPERVDEPRRGPPGRDQQGSDQGQKKAGKKAGKKNKPR